MKKGLLWLAFAIIFAPGDAPAWGADGHRAVGAIADLLLEGSNAQKQVDALLLPGESLASIANWIDCVKGSYCGAQTPEMVAYVAANPMHARYHYTDIPFQREQYRDGDAGSHAQDIVHILGQAIAVLQGKAGRASNPYRFTRRQALLLVTHLAGDVHQPLHVGAAYVGKDGGFVAPETAAQIDAIHIFDARGGNQLLLDAQQVAAGAALAVPPGEDGKAAARTARPAAKPLHAYWDSTVVAYAMRRSGAATPEQFALRATQGKPAVAANTGALSHWPYQWADDALRAAKLAYAGVAPGKSTRQARDNGAVEITWSIDVPPDYAVPSSELAGNQLIKAGYRLAFLLQAVWP